VRRGHPGAVGARGPVRRRRRPWLACAWLALPAALLAGAGPLQAQQIRFSGHGDHEVDAHIMKLLAAPHTLITRDTLIAAGDTVTGPLLILGASATIAGTVRGDVIGVASDLFLRPTARIEGDVVNAGGGLFGSSLATITGSKLDRPLVPYHVDRGPAGLRIRAGPQPRASGDMAGPLGFAAPGYDRVNGVDVRWGLHGHLPVAGPLALEASALGDYYSQRGALGGRATFAIALDSVRVSVGVQREAVSNEEWIRNDLSNSVSYLFLGHDYHDLYEARRAWLGADASFATGSVKWRAGLRLQREAATPLHAADPWTVVSVDSIRPNLVVDTGTVGSVIASLSGGWRGGSAVLRWGGSVERASPRLAGTRSFSDYQAWGDVALHTLGRQTLRLRGWARGPLPGTDSLPRRRWTFVGGAGTLYTFPIAAFRGDRMVMVETRYSIPLPSSAAAPLLGPPRVDLVHDVGMAWTLDEPRRFEQNAGVELRFYGVVVRLVTDPRNVSRELKLGVGAYWPFGATFPWASGEPRE
jgi:hypothetical protein